MARKLRWGATAVPEWKRIVISDQRAMARKTLRMAMDLEGGKLQLAPNIKSAAPGYEHFLRPDYYRGESLKHICVVDELLEGANYWVTRAMAAVALDASSDVEGFDASGAPSPSGFLLVEGGLPAMTLTEGTTLADRRTRKPMQWTGQVPVDGFLWVRRPGSTLLISILCRAASLPGETTAGAIIPIESWPVDAVMPDFPTGERYRDEPPERVSATAFLAAAWHLMQIPTLAERKTLDTRTGRETTGSPPPERLVTSVDLRPLRHVRMSDEPGEGHRLTHRHYVRGHWRNQAHGPGHSLRKRMYVEPYIKGPEGAPLLMHDQVQVWRR